MYCPFAHHTSISSAGGSSFPVHPIGKKWHVTAVLGCALAGGGASRDVITVIAASSYLNSGNVLLCVADIASNFASATIDCCFAQGS